MGPAGSVPDAMSHSCTWTHPAVGRGLSLLRQWLGVKWVSIHFPLFPAAIFIILSLFFGPLDLPFLSVSFFSFCFFKLMFYNLGLGEVRKVGFVPGIVANGMNLILTRPLLRITIQSDWTCRWSIFLGMILTIQSTDRTRMVSTLQLDPSLRMTPTVQYNPRLTLIPPSSIHPSIVIEYGGRFVLHLKSFTSCTVKSTDIHISHDFTQSRLLPPKSNEARRERAVRHAAPAQRTDAATASHLRALRQRIHP